MAHHRRHPVVTQAARVERWRNERRAEGVHLHERGEVPGVAEVERVRALREARARSRLDRDHADLGLLAQRASDEREREPREVRAAAGAADEDVGVVLGLVHLHLRLVPDHGLVHEDVVEDRAERVLRVVARRGRLDGLGDGHTERAGRVGILGEDRASRVRLLGRAGDDAAAERLDEPAPIRLLVVRGSHHPDVDLEPEDGRGERERRAPLAGARLGREALYALLLVVVRLRDGRVRLVRPGRRDALVLVVDARGRLERLLEPARAVERRRAPLPVDRAHLLRDRDEAIGRDLLADDRHREERREIVRPNRLPSARMQHGRRRFGQIGRDVVPGLR